MSVLEILGPAIVILGLSSALVVALAQRKVLRKTTVKSRSFHPVSILKPLKGVDPELEENLRSIFRQDYPNFEVILGAEDPSDPALKVAEKISAEFPSIQTNLVRGAGEPLSGLNPKVNNLANLSRHSWNPLILISDSNVRVDFGYLSDLVARRDMAGGGLVWSLFRGTNGLGLGGQIEALQLNTVVMGGMCALTGLLSIPCALGKSMLLGKNDLESVGGWDFLSCYLAEDSVLSEEMTKNRLPVTVTPHLIDNVLGYRTVSGFAARHIRWEQLRINLKFFGYFFEVFLNPVFWAIVFCLLERTIESVATLELAILAMSIMDYSTERVLGVSRPFWKYFGLEVVLGLFRGILWFVPFFSSTVTWRGNKVILGRRSLITFKNLIPIQEPQSAGQK